MSGLKSLKDHNDDVLRVHSARNAPRPNGIACPKCGAELVDVAPHMVCASNPPQLAVACPNCAYSGYRFV